jgi:hypothetical protein
LRCINSTFTLAGNNPASGTGQWTFVGGSNGATITNPALYNTPFDGPSVPLGVPPVRTT